MCPVDRDPPADELDETQPSRQRGTSPVVQRTRSKLGTIAGCIGIALVVAFLFLTGGKAHTPQGKQKPTLAAVNDSSAFPTPPDTPASDPAHSFEVEHNPQHFESTNSRGGGQSADAERQKADARRHSPMLIYDASEHAGTAVQVKPTSPDALNSLLAAQLQNAASPPITAGESPDDRHRDRSSPSEGYAERTQAFAHAASDEQVPEANAHRISMDNRIAQGKMVPAILETAMSSDLPGKLRAIVSQDVWSEDGSRRLIRRGSRLAGEYRSGVVRGQTRVFVIWTRVLQPDGTDVAIGSPGTDDLGRAGLTGTIDWHFVERFGAAFLLSLIGSATTASQGGNTFVINTSQGFGQVAQESLQDSINIPPTIYVDQGTPVQVFVARDLVFDLPPVARAAER